MFSRTRTTKRHPAFTKKAIAELPEANDTQQLAREAVAYEVMEIWEKPLPAGTKYEKDGATHKTSQDDVARLHIIKLVNANGEMSNTFGMVQAPWGTHLTIYSITPSFLVMYEILKAKGYKRIF